MSGNDKKIDEAVISEERAETAISRADGKTASYGITHCRLFCHSN